MVADSALYTQENLQLLTNIRWLSRVPVRNQNDYKSISNLTPERLELLKFFPPSCQRYYLVSEET